jgi:hypothetical protein
VSSVINPLLNYLANSGYNEFGKLFVIINRGTFSSALLNAITLNQEYNSILLGVNTGLFFPDFTGLRFPLFHVN